VTVAVFNTHAFVKRLTAVGMPEPQAEALADEQMRLIDERLATKTDIARLEAASKEDIARLAATTKGDIARLEATTTEGIAKLQASTKSDLAALEASTRLIVSESKSETLKWVMGMIGFQTVVVVGTVIALARMAH
jgi:uncharacterized protein